MNKDYKSINNLWKDSEGYRYFGTLKLSSKIKYDGDDFIPLWEWINQLQQENKQLKDNWNKLKEYIKQEPTLYFYNDKLPFEVIMVKIITKMQEIEQGSDSNDSN